MKELLEQILNTLEKFGDVDIVRDEELVERIRQELNLA